MSPMIIAIFPIVKCSDEELFRENHDIRRLEIFFHLVV